MQLRRGKLDGWQRFCNRIGVNPDAVAAPFIKDVEWIMDIALDVLESLSEDDAPERRSAEPIATRELEALVDAWGEAD